MYDVTSNFRWVENVVEQKYHGMVDEEVLTQIDIALRTNYILLFRAIMDITVEKLFGG